MLKSKVTVSKKLLFGFFVPLIIVNTASANNGTVSSAWQRPRVIDFIEVPGQLIGGHKLYRFVEGEPNVVWTEPLREQKATGLLGWTIGVSSLLGNEIAKMNYDAFINRCIELNPRHRQEHIRRLVEIQLLNPLFEQKWPMDEAGCYPPFIGDLDRFVDARTVSTYSVFKYKPPTISGFDQWFRSASVRQLEGAFGVDLGIGEVFWDRGDALRAGMCRCVDVDSINDGFSADDCFSTNDCFNLRSLF